jgi:hypothetical protein
VAQLFSFGDMKVTTYYTLLPLTFHAAMIGVLTALRALPIEALRSAPGMAVFLLGGIVLLPCLLLYILTALVRRQKLQEASQVRLFLSGACNPVPALFLLWLVAWVSALLHHA